MSPAVTDRCAERGFYSSAEEVFWAFLDEEVVKKFILGLSPGAVTLCKLEPIVGGAITIVEEKDGQSLKHQGEFAELQAPARLAFTLDSQTVSVSLSAGKADDGDKNGCRVRLVWGDDVDVAHEVLEALAVAMHDLDKAPVTTSASVQRLFSVSAGEVFDAWLNPEAIAKFMFSVADGRDQVLEIKVDPEVGGEFSFVILRAGQRIVHAGHYLVIHRPSHLSFTWGAEENAKRSEVTIEVIEAADACEVFLTQQLPPAWASFKPQAEAAWQKMLHALASLLGSD